VDLAKVIGGIATSHLPLIDEALQRSPNWGSVLDSFSPVNAWLKKMKPDVAVVFFSNNSLSYCNDKMPTFAIGSAAHYQYEDGSRGIYALSPYQGAPELSWHITWELVTREFEPVTCREMAVDQVFDQPLKLFWPEHKWCPVRTIPICINTGKNSFPSVADCCKLGKAVGRAIDSWEEDLRVMVVGNCGHSHQLEEQRNGFINNAFDIQLMRNLIKDPTLATQYAIEDLIEQTGCQGMEMLNGLAARSVLTGQVRELYSNYNIPILDTTAGLILLERA
jgi:protocatechuate 4,5-dioxygenase beta chain